MRAVWEKWTFWVSAVFSAAAIGLVIANAFLQSENRTIQSDVNQRQQFVNQTIQLNRLHEELIRALAASAVANKDDKLREILAQVGITFTTNPPAAPGADGKTGR